MFPKEIFDETPNSKWLFEINLNTKCLNGTVLLQQRRQDYFQIRETFASVLKSKYTNPPKAHVCKYLYLHFKGDSRHRMLPTNNINNQHQQKGSQPNGVGPTAKGEYETF